jgi:alkylation response protein AidB-like acyl-CoA dehydrogenase
MMSSDPQRARRALSILGRALYDTEPKSMWERDTEMLPRVLRTSRHRYRAFAREHIAPSSLSADRDPKAFDVRPLFVRAAQAGLQTELMPSPWGTMQLSALRHGLLFPAVLKAEEFCTACGGIGLGLLAHELGIAPLFVSGDLHAYLQLQGKIYRACREGEPAIAAFAITEPGAGSDVEESEGASKARLSCFYRKDQGGYRVSGRKCFISNGAVAKWVTLFAAEQGRGIDSWTCFLIDASSPGYAVGRQERKMGQRAADASELILENVFVPADRVVGAVGAGWAINRNVLNFSRPAVAAIALGIARGAFEHATEFCNEAQLGGRPLNSYQDVQLALADMLVKITAMRAMVWHAVRYTIPFQGAGAMAKVFCSDTAWEVCNAAIALLGDHGTRHGNHVEKAARDARLTQIYEGTNQINRLAVFESQTGAEFR